MRKLFSQEAEFALLGLLVREPNLILKVSGAITSEDFYFVENRDLFEAIEESVSENDVVDNIVLLDFLDFKKTKTRKDWAIYLGEISIEAGVKENIDQYIKIIKDKSTERKLENVLLKSKSMISEEQGSVEEKISRVESDLLDVTKTRDLKGFVKIDSLTEEFALRLKNIEENGYQEGMKTDIRALDKVLGGFNAGDLIIVAARPSMGKTAFALELTKNISKKGNVCFFSLEMPSEQLYQRLSSSEAMLGQSAVREYQNLTINQKEAFQIAVSSIDKLNIWIDDSPNNTLEQLIWKARKLNSTNQLDMIVIDYLQLVDTAAKHESRQQKVSEISRKLKVLARELEVPIIALSQLSRGVESRDDKRPRMSDIRESGSIEQDADIVMLLYRDSYYNKEITTNIQELEVNIAKHRNGPTGTAVLNFDISVGKVFDKPFYGGKK